MTSVSTFSKITSADLKYFESIVGETNCLVDIATLNAYSSDHTEDFVFPPQVVLKPNSTGEVSKILTYCNDRFIPVTARGAGTGLSGGSLPVFGGVGLSMERFNQILDIDTVNLQATVEPGVIIKFFRKQSKPRASIIHQIQLAKGLVC